MKIKIITVLVCCCMFAAPKLRSEDPILVLFKPAQMGFQGLSNLSFRAKMDVVSYFQNEGKKQEVKAGVNVSFECNYPCFACKTTFQDVSTGRTNSVVRAFDGDRYQNYEDSTGWLILGKSIPRELPYNTVLPIFVPYLFLFDDGANFSVAELRKDKTWFDFFGRAKLLGEEIHDGKKVVIVGVAGVNGEGLKTEYRIVLDKDLNFYPVSWTAKHASGKTSEMKVVKYDFFGGSKWPIPLKIQTRDLNADGTLFGSSTIELERNTFMQKEISKEHFVIPSTQAETIWDDDLKIKIKAGGSIPANAGALHDK